MNKPWWYNLAHLGSSVGIGIGVAAGFAQFVPGPVSVAAGVIGAIAHEVTNYANKGIAAADDGDRSISG
jgi:hypothetical protein